MNATPAQVTAALDLFTKRHPPHADLNGVHRSTHPDPTTDHIMVACGCGYRWRYGARELAVPAEVIRVSEAVAARMEPGEFVVSDLTPEQIRQVSTPPGPAAVLSHFKAYTVRPFVRTPKPT